MTRGSDRSVVVLPAEMVGNNPDIFVFSLPHSSNNSLKARVTLIKSSLEEVYQLKARTFSKGPRYSNTADLANDVYHYTDDGSPLKSTVFTNEKDRSDGYILEDGSFQYAQKYDITYNLIGFFHSEGIRGEQQYPKEEAKFLTGSNASEQTNSKFLTLRDYQDLLIDSHDENWTHISSDVLKAALEKISGTVEEAGDTYYKITSEKIVEYLTQKINKIVLNFPKSLPLPTNTPQEIQDCAKVVMATNILISLIPKEAYVNILHIPVSDTAGSKNIIESCSKFKKYISENENVIKEREMLMKAAMNVGLGNVQERAAPKAKIIKKPTLSKSKVAKGKGAIDGFFKRAK